MNEDGTSRHGSGGGFSALTRHAPALLRASCIVTLYVVGWLVLNRATQVFETAPSVSPWYPPPALSLALVLIFGPRYIPALLIGPLLSGLWLDPLPIAPFYVILYALISTVGYGTAGVLLRQRLRGNPRLLRMHDVAWLVGVGAIAAPLVVALLSVADLSIAGLLTWPDYLIHTRDFWVGDAIGVLILAPFLLIYLLAWVARSAYKMRADDETPIGRRKLGSRVILELLAQAASLILTPWVIFSLNIPRAFCFIPLIWLALRYGLPGAAISILALNVEVMLAIRLWNATVPNLIDMQLFMIALAFTGLFTGAIASEYKQAVKRLRRQNDYMAALHEMTLAIVKRLELDDLLEAIVVRAGALMGTPHGFIYLIDTETDELVLRVGVGVFTMRSGRRLKHGEGLAGEIWRSGQSLAVDDYNTWPRQARDVNLPAFHALAGVPLTSASQVIGVIGLAYVEPNRRFSDEAVTVLSRFAQLASLALENARLYDAAQQELAERKRAVEALRETERNLRLIAENTSDVVFAYDMNRRLLYQNAAFEGLTEYSLAELRAHDMLNYMYPDDEGRMRALLESVFQGNSFADVEYRIITRSGKVKWCSSSCGPLLDERGVQIGVQGVERDISERKRVEETQYFLVEASAMLVTSLDYETTLVSVARLAVPILADWCVVSLLEADGTIRRIGSAHADPSKEPLLHEMLRRYPLEPNWRDRVPEVLSTGRTEIAADASKFWRATEAQDAEQDTILSALGFNSYMFVPLTARGRTLGVFTFVQGWSGRRYGEADQSLAEDLAHRVALAVDNARLYHAAKRRLAELTTVQNVAWAINSTLRLDEIFRTVVHQISSVFGYQLVSIYLLDGGGVALQAYVGYEDVMWFIELDRGLTGRVARSGQAMFVRDAADEPDFIVVAPGTRQAIIIPLKRGDGEVLGLLLVESTGAPVLKDDDFALLTLLGDQISVAIANARLFGELRASEQRYRSLLEQAADSIFVTDPEGHILDANEQATVLLGYTRDELLRMHLPDLIVLADSAPAQEKTAILRGSGRATMALNLRRRDGGIFPVEISAAAIDAGVVLAIVRDVSERLRLEAQLRQAQKLEAIGTLANGIAHDFNNLLAAITGYADLALDATPSDDPRHDDLSQIARAAERGAALTRQLLTFSRPAAPERRPLRLADLMSETLHLLRPTIPSTIDIRAELPDDNWLVEADAAQLQQVLVNLVVNARDALPDGGAIRIVAANVLLDADQARRLNTPPGRYVRLSVIDSGIGMDERTASRIFEPFFTTKAHGKGTGLGLAVTHGIVRGHGGVIEVESQPSQGTTIAIYLPASTAAPHPAEDAPQVARHGQDELILVVDDDPAVCQLGQRILERYGYRTLTAEDGRTAVAIFSAHQAEVAAVVLDLTMPGMDGRATFYALREISDVPIIFSSGQSAAELVVQLAAPDTVFIAKPYNLAELTRAVAQTIQAARRPVGQ